MMQPPNWNPTPSPTYNDEERRAYNAGYSDGYHGYNFGAAYAESPPTGYRLGFAHGQRAQRA